MTSTASSDAPGVLLPPQKASSGHGSEAPSAWVQRWSHLVPAGGRVLDVACGLGRHTRFFSEKNHPVSSVDRSEDAINLVKSIASLQPVEALLADIENGPWPFAGRTFDAVVVTNYLWRPLLPVLVQSVAPGGVLIYETFAQENGRFGKPSNPAFLLAPGELLDFVRAEAGLRVIAFEDGYVATPRPAMLQRICVIKSSGGALQDTSQLAL